MRGDNDHADEALPPEEAVAPVTVGRVLRSTRAARRLSLEQVAAELRMEPAMLAALEEDRFEALGAPVFVKGYLKHYGERLGLDHHGLLGLYHDQAGAQDLPMVPRRSAEMEDAAPIAGRVVAVAAVIMGAVAGAAWWLYEDAGAPPPSAVSAPPSVVSAPPERPASVSAPAVGDAARTSGDDEAALLPTPPPAAEPVESATGARDGPATPGVADAARPAAGAAAADAAVAEAAGVAAAGTAGAAAAVAETGAFEPPDGSLLIEMTMEADCWTEVTDARGERLYYGLAAAGETLRLAGEPPVSFLLGNADAVALSIAGQPYPVPVQGRRGELARFTVSASAAP